MIVQHELNASRQARIRLRELETGSGGNTLLELNQPLMVLGSGADCEVALPPNGADSAHAAIVLLGNTAYLCDLGAPAGTALNGRRIRWARLADGDELAINKCRFRVELDEDPRFVTGEQPSFKLQDDASIGEVATIDPVLIVGSDPGCDVVLHDETVAPRHCLVVWTQDGPLLRSLQGSDAVRLNDRPVRSSNLVGGDRIAIGPHEMTFEIDSDSMEFFEKSRVKRSDGVRVQSGKTIIYHGEEPRTPALISGRIAKNDALDLELLWPELNVASPERAKGELFAEAEEAVAPRADQSTAAEPKAATVEQPSKAAAPPADLTVEEMLEPLDSEENLPELEADVLGRDVESAEPVEVDMEVFEIDDEEEPAVNHNFAVEDEQTELAELIQQSASTEHVNRSETASGADQAGLSEDRMARMRTRVAAAQKALDQRASKHLEQLNGERQRLRAYEAELEKKAAELLHFARENRRMLNQERVAPEPANVAVKASEELVRMGRLVSDIQTIEATHATEAPAGSDRRNEASPESTTVIGPLTLQQRAAELADLVRAEQDEIDRAESRFASLRVGIRRLREFVDRTETRHRSQATELDSFVSTLRQEETLIEKERSLLLNQLQDLDGRLASVRGRLDDVGRDREDLDHELERLAQAQKALADKDEALRSGLEMERRRIQIRQAQLQRKATDLARAARDKRCAVEAEISKRRAALDVRETELRTHRAALEEAGRAELEKAATELEHVLGMRLAGIEAEMGTRNTDINSQTPGRTAATANPNQLDRSNDFSINDPLPGTVTLAGMLRETIEGRNARLTGLQRELDALRDAMTKLGRQNNEHEASRDEEIGTLRSTQSAGRRDFRRAPTTLRDQFDQDKATLRGAEEQNEDCTVPGAEAAPLASALGGSHGGETRSGGC